MEDLIIIGNESFDIGVLQDTIMAKVDTLNNIAIDPSRITALETIRTENNDFIKSYESRVKEVFDLVTAPVMEKLQPVLDSLKPLKEANKDFADKILDSKKESFKETVKAEWMNIGLAGDGDLPPFEKVYDDKWYGKARKVWMPLLSAKIKKVSQMNERHDFIVRVRCTYSELSEIEGLLIDKGNYYEIKVED